MGAVWLGRDTSLDRNVAIKQIGQAPGSESADTVRARREAVLGARVINPHVVTVLDLVSEGDQHWLIMEYVGPSLAQRIRERGPLGPDEVAPLLAQAAAALDAAHSVGVVHRDVKPSNLLIAADGSAKLSDFGVARGDTDATLTRTGLVTGSPAYLAPEVASGGSATPATDMWALGATLVHAVTGKPPYSVDAANPLATLYAIVHEPAPRPAEAGWLAPLVEATMTHDPASRWSAAEAREFLESRGARMPGQSDTATAKLPPVAPAPSAAPVSPVSAAPPGPPPTTTPSAQAVSDRARTHARRSAPRRRPLVIAAAVALIALLSAGAFLVGARMIGGDEDPTAGAGGPSGAGRSGPDGTADPTGGTSTDSGRDDESGDESGDGSGEAAEDVAKDLERFVEDYLKTAPKDPEESFAMLTPEFQEASGGLEGYRGWWEPIERTEIYDVETDPGALTVTYEYRYEFEDGRSFEETVTLQLVRDGEEYLIADEV